MKNRVCILLVGFLSLSGFLVAQESELTIPFSQPNAAKTLDIEMFSGTVKIIGTSRQDILVKYTVVEDDEHEHEENDRSSGLRKISGKNLNLKMGEKDNEAYIKSESWMQPINMEIEVPQELTLNIEKNMGDLIHVSGVKGDLNIECAVGSIEADHVNGNVNASTAAGEIKIQFDEIPDPKSMIINNHTGDIDLTFPATYKADLKMKTSWGDIYSDLDITTIPTQPDMKRSEEDGELRIVTETWTKATLNGGGPEITLKTMMGNIYLRKNE